MSKREGDRVLGPYRDRQGWRYKLVVGGSPTWVRCRPGSTEESAGEEVAAARAELGRGEGTDTVKGVVAAYLTALAARAADATVTCERHALAPLVAAHGDRETLTARHAEAHLVAVGAGRSLATARGYWLAFARMTRWADRRGLLSDVAAEAVRRRERTDQPMPWATREARKRMGRGKRQLAGLTEVRAYVAAALALRPMESNAATTSGEERRVAALLPVLTGASSGEVLHLTVRDVDVAGRILWVRDDDDPEGWAVKTSSRRRKLELPPSCETDLRMLCADRDGGAYLFAQRARSGVGTDGAARTPTWLRKLVREVCKAADVQPVTPHGLRGTYASLLHELAGIEAARIGDRLGHADAGKTARRAYLGTETSPTLEVLEGGLSRPRQSGGTVA